MRQIELVLLGTLLTSFSAIGYQGVECESSSRAQRAVVLLSEQSSGAGSVHFIDLEKGESLAESFRNCIGDHAIDSIELNCSERELHPQRQAASGLTELIMEIQILTSGGDPVNLRLRYQSIRSGNAESIRFDRCRRVEMDRNNLMKWAEGLQDS